MKNLAQMPRRRETRREQFSFPLIFSILVLLAALSLGVVVCAINPIYGLAVAGAFILVIVVLLRWDELTVALIIAVHLWIDYYLSLHLVGILMALLLLFVYYFGRSDDHPWIGPRLLGLWGLFLTLTIYPAINGGQFQLYDAATYYPSVILGAFMIFWIGNIIAKDNGALRRVLQLLSLIAFLVAIHTIIQTTTGHFLFASARADMHLQTAGNLDIIGTGASRATSFLGDPNWNGCFLATMFFLPLGLIFESKSLLGKLVYLAEMTAILVALLFTYSNGSMIAFLGGIVAFIFWVGSRRNRLLWISMISLIVLFVLVLFQAQLRIELQHASAQNEILLRQGPWETGIRVIEAFPLFGVGLGGQAYLLRAEPYRVPNQFVPLEAPHNSYLQWGAMAGIPVLVVFLLLLGFAFWHSWHNWRSVDIHCRPLLGGAITALVALSINSVSIDGWTNPVMAMIGWLIFGMVTSPLIGRCLRHQSAPPVDMAEETILAQTEVPEMDMAKQGSCYE